MLKKIDDIKSGEVNSLNIVRITDEGSSLCKEILDGSSWERLGMCHNQWVEVGDDDGKCDVIAELMFIHDEKLVNKIENEGYILFSRYVCLVVKDNIGLTDEAIAKGINGMSMYKYMYPVLVCKVMIQDNRDIDGLAFRDVNGRECAIAYIDGELVEGETHMDCIYEIENEIGTLKLDSLGRDGYIEEVKDNKKVFLGFKILSNKYYIEEHYYNEVYTMLLYDKIDKDTIIIIEDAIACMTEEDVRKELTKLYKNYRVIVY